MFFPEKRQIKLISLLKEEQLYYDKRVICTFSWLFLYWIGQCWIFQYKSKCPLVNFNDLLEKICGIWPQENKNKVQQICNLIFYLNHWCRDGLAGLGLEPHVMKNGAMFNEGTPETYKNAVLSKSICNLKFIYRYHITTTY